MVVKDLVSDAAAKTRRVTEEDEVLPQAVEMRQEINSKSGAKRRSKFMIAPSFSWFHHGARHIISLFMVGCFYQHSHHKLSQDMATFTLFLLLALWIVVW